MLLFLNQLVALAYGLHIFASKLKYISEAHVLDLFTFAVYASIPSKAELGLGMTFKQ